jgi:hypothetical protein
MFAQRKRVKISDRDVAESDIQAFIIVSLVGIRSSLSLGIDLIFRSCVG